MVKQENKKKKKKRQKRSLLCACVSIIRNKERYDESRGRTDKRGQELKNTMKRQKEQNKIRKNEERILKKKKEKQI